MDEHDHTDEWLARLAPEERQALETTLATVDEIRDAGVTVYPPKDKVLQAIALAAPDDVRCVILGQDPYHGANQAMGLSFSVPDGVTVPPSLRNVFAELESDLNVKPQTPSGDLTRWATGGVLLLNATLTVEAGKPQSHANIGWQAVTKALLRVTLLTSTPTVYLLWGKSAQNTMRDALATVSELSAPKRAIVTTHPSPYSATRPAGNTQAFIGSRCFSKANRMLEDAGAKPIDWQL